jgi:hypothetical protein
MITVISWKDEWITDTIINDLNYNMNKTNKWQSTWSGNSQRGHLSYQETFIRVDSKAIGYVQMK